MEHGLSASSHLLSLLPPIKFWYIWSDISGIMGGWLRKVKIIKKMHKNQEFQRAWTSKKFQSLLFLEDMLWSEKESPIPSFLSCRRLLPWLISYLYCSRLSTEHLTLSSPRAKMYLYLCIQMALWKECSATWELGILLAAVCRTEANEQSINSAWLKRQSENIWVGQSLVELVGCMLSIAESARRWEFMVPPSSAEQLCAVRVQLFGAESATELRVQGLNWKETEH